MTGNYQILISKLDEFIRKYYKNFLIKGTIYSIATILIFYIVITMLEYFGHFGIVMRTIMFYSFIFINLGILYYYFFTPLLKLYHIGKIISHEQAAEIIGKHFSDIKDKLLNTLQLKHLADSNPDNTLLIEASINQRIEQLSPVPFPIAIDLKKNRKYIKYAGIPLLLLLFMIIAAPGLITAPTNRIIHHGTYFEREAPFQFAIQNKSMQAIQQEDFLLSVKITGDEIPENVFVEINGNEYQLTKDNTVNFHYNFKNLQKDQKFQLFADKYYSKEYEIVVIPKPIILNFDVTLVYPSYLDKQDESLINTGDLIIPEGTQIKWHFLTRDTKEMKLRFKDKTINTQNKSENSFSYTEVFKNSQNYSIIPANNFLKNNDSLTYSINVIADAYPTVKVVEYSDSINKNQRYYKGMIKDDYGFRGLTFNYRKLNCADSLITKRSEIKSVKINNSITQQEFYFYYDFSDIATEPGDEFEYYFEVWDNDGVNGSKSTRSQKLIYKLPSKEELEKKTEESNEQIKNELTESITEAKKLQKQIEKFSKDLVDKKTLTWQEKKQLQDILDLQKNLQNKVDLIQKENLKKSSLEEQYQKDNTDLLKKQEELNKLFNELMTDEMKELFKKIQDMLDKLDKDKVSDMLDKMKLSSKDLEKQLDRNLELFKQLEFEKQLNETIEKLNELSEKQKDLSQKTEKANSDKNEQLKNEQSELNKEFQDVRKDMDSLQKKNENLENPNNLEKTDTEENSIQQEMQNSMNNLNNNKNKKASESQKNAAEQMQELADKMEQMQEEMQEEKEGEDINTLRDILENLIKASFDQEDLINQLGEVKTSDPQYNTLIQQQKNLKDDIQMIEDSLFALSKRQSQIESFVNQEISEINDNVKNAITQLNLRNTSTAKSKQQSAMTSINNLALMLSETLSAMQKQMMEQKSGSCSKPGSCKKPGNGKPSFKSIRQLQEQLNKSMENLKNGTNPNGKDGNKSMSEQLAKLAAQQEALRRQLQELAEQLKEEGNTNTGNLNKLMDKMEETETDLVNKILSGETIERQKEILTRLLESEKAEKERELDEKRESNEAKNQNYSNPTDFFKYNSIKLKEVELLKTIPPSLKSFYKNKVNEYFYNFVK
ncbi:MAG TPA: hypothetical protein PKK00_04130 [Bacteroidales bacterium]|nr:hypothetical protein [Bacteroidales bacterium]HPS16629.1 hypothetical protein [Bacteroidales bacterium]